MSHVRTPKKVQFTMNTKDDPAIFPDNLPPNYFHLADNCYASVSYFSGAVRIHIRQYKQSESGSLYPTKKGVTLLPSQWSSLMKDFESYQEMLGRDAVVVVNDSLLLSIANIDNTRYVNFQRYFMRNDLTRHFIPAVCLLTEFQFQSLKDMQGAITTSIIALLFKRIFPECVKEEISKASPTKLTKIENEDAEMILSTSLIELLKLHLGMNINSQFVCNGCLNNYENQLGHDCLTFSYDQKLTFVGDFAILNMNLRELAADFVKANVQIINYVNDSFLNHLDMSNLLKNAKEMYVASDPIPHRMF